MMIRMIESHITAYITNKFGYNPTILNFLLKHPKRMQLEMNLASEINKLEKTHPTRLSSMTLAFIIEEYAKMFCKAAIEAKEQEILSDNERIRRQLEADKHKLAEYLLNKADKDGQKTKE